MIHRGVAKQTATSANFYVTDVRGEIQTLQQERGRAVRDEAIAFHLAHPQAALLRAPLGGLPRQHVELTPGPRLDLVGLDLARLQTSASSAKNQCVSPYLKITIND